MRNTLMIAALLAFVLAGCQPKVQNLNVKQDHLSHTTGDWSIEVKHSVFSSSTPAVNKSCEVLNGEIQKCFNGLIDSLKADATDFFNTFVTDTTNRPVWSYELVAGDSVFMATDEYVSVLLTVYTFTGGAHGMPNFYAFNYDVKNQKLLSPKDIVNYSKEKAINTLLKAHFKNPDDCFTTDPTLDAVTVINFNRKELCFTYAQYVLGAYACGVAQINVPRTELKGDLFIH